MDPMSGATSAADPVRAAARFSLDYFLRTLQIMAVGHGGDLLDGIILHAISRANTQHLDQAGAGLRFAADNDNPSDELRRPISVNAVAQSLNLPFETVRRRVIGLCEKQLCVRAARGVFIPAAVFASADASAARIENYANLKRLLRDLERIGMTTSLSPSVGASARRATAEDPAA